MLDMTQQKFATVAHTYLTVLLYVFFSIWAIYLSMIKTWDGWLFAWDVVLQLYPVEIVLQLYPADVLPYVVQLVGHVALEAAVVKSEDPENILGLFFVLLGYIIIEIEG